jgi:hypothetical protein
VPVGPSSLPGDPHRLDADSVTGEVFCTDASSDRRPDLLFVYHDPSTRQPLPRVTRSSIRRFGLRTRRGEDDHGHPQDLLPTALGGSVRRAKVVRSAALHAAVRLLAAISSLRRPPATPARLEPGPAFPVPQSTSTGPPGTSLLREVGPGPTESLSPVSG